MIPKPNPGPRFCDPTLHHYTSNHLRVACLIPKELSFPGTGTDVSFAARARCPVTKGLPEPLECPVLCKTPSSGDSLQGTDPLLTHQLALPLVETKS